MNTSDDIELFKENLTDEEISNIIDGGAIILADNETKLLYDKKTDPDRYIEYFNTTKNEYIKLIFGYFDFIKSNGYIRFINPCAINTIIYDYEDIMEEYKNTGKINRNRLMEEYVNCMLKTNILIESDIEAAKKVLGDKTLEDGKKIVDNLVEKIKDPKIIEKYTKETTTNIESAKGMIDVLSGKAKKKLKKKKLIQNMSYTERLAYTKDKADKKLLEKKRREEYVEILKGNPDYANKSEKELLKLAEVYDTGSSTKLSTKLANPKLNIKGDLSKSKDIIAKAVKNKEERLAKEKIELAIKTSTDLEKKKEADIQSKKDILDAKINEAKMSIMSDDEKLAYKKEVAKNTLERLNKEKAELEEKVEETVEATLDIGKTVDTAKNIVDTGISAKGALAGITTVGTGVAGAGASTVVLPSVIIIIVIVAAIALGAAIIIIGGIWGAILMLKNNPIDDNNPNKHALKIYLSLCGFSGNWIYIIYCLFKYGFSKMH
jgi:hypothetical protein